MANLLKKVDKKTIEENSNIKKFFKVTKFKNINVKKILLCGDFFLDTSNYFPILKDHHLTFPGLYDWDLSSSKFYTKEFNDNFFSNNFSYKEISDVFVLGSSPGNNYYRNIYTFLNRLFFIGEKKINIAIHRNTSNKFRDFISYLLDIKKIKLGKFVFLDDGFYLFRNSQIPAFLNFRDTMEVYQDMFRPSTDAKNNIYVSRRNARWRRVINESDFYSDFYKYGFDVIDFENLTIAEQIKISQNTKRIIAPNGSGLTNLIFANPKINVIEIRKSQINKEFLKLYLNQYQLYLF